MYQRQKKFDFLWQIKFFIWIGINQVEVTGCLLTNDARMGKVTYTIQDPVDGSIQFCSVEQLAIHHYRIEEDYTYGKISCLVSF